MELSLFLAKLLGLYLLIMAVIWIVRRKEVDLSAKQIIASRGMLALQAAGSILFGLFIVIDHPIYELSWRGLITLIGYLCILRGLLRLAFPVQVQRLGTKMLTKWFIPAIILIFVIGAILTYYGFMMGRMV